MSNVNTVVFTIVVILFVFVTFIGFAAARWRRAEDMLHLNEWGLGGRSYGTFIGWFLLGGDLYTAYTFIAVPALVFASGSIGFFAVSYTIMVFPIAFIFLPRLWSVCRVHNYITPADFIRGRYGSRGLSLAAAFTGILSLLPYIALQLVGIQAVLTVMGVGTSSNNKYVEDIPLFVAFVVLAIYTYVSGLRAPAAISFVKDTLIYVFVIVAVFYIPTRLGGWGHIFGTAQTHFAAINPETKKPNGTFIPTSKSVGSTQFDFATLALGSALALFLYPHTITGALATKRRNVVKRNMALLPAYSVLLACIALFGYMALTDKTTAAEVKKAGNTQLAVPYLLQHMFPSWFDGDLVRRDHHRRPGARGDHGDRRGEPVHQEHLQGVLQAGRLAPAGDAGVPVGIPRGQVRRAGVRGLAAAHLRHQPPAARRRVDLAAPPDAGGRPVHPLVPPLGAADRLGGRHDLRHDRRVQRVQPDLLALGVVVGHRVRAQRLHRVHRGSHQHRRVGGADADPQGRSGSPGAPTRRCRTSTPPTPWMPRRPSPRASAWPPRPTDQAARR